MGCPFTPAPPPAPKKVAPAAARTTAAPSATDAGSAESAQPAEEASGTSSTEASDAPGTAANESAASTGKADADARPIDLTQHYGLKAEQFDAIKQYPWHAVPRGSQTFAGVPLEIGGTFSLFGEENAKRGLKFPEEFTGIAIGRPF